jgi:hypothetical protein
MLLLLLCPGPLLLLVGATRCSRVTSDALQNLLEGCKALHRLVLPLQLQLPAVLVGRAHSLEVDEDEERQVLLLDKDHTGLGQQ